MLQGKINKRLSDQEAAQRALSELSSKLQARQAAKNRAEKIMNRTEIYGGKL